MAQATLYAVLVGINVYDGDVRNLHGCEYDTRMMRRFLRQYATANDLTLNAHTLFDGDANREAVIKSFAHFRAAGPDDFCVFYYSGHGSEVLAPPELAHLQADGKLQTLVCHDSRTTAQDLTDKELSHLIWEATTDERGQDRGTHFLAIFDSCHSGSVSRNTALTPRLITGSLRMLSFDSMYGHIQFDGMGQERFPRMGRHVTLSAARAYELAYEKRYKGIPRGVFTTTLLEALGEESLQGLTYGQLVTLVNARLHPEVQHMQHPIREVLGTWPDEEPILFGRARHTVLKHFLYFDPKAAGWFLNAGAMQQIAEGQQLTVHLADDTTGQAVVRDVDPGQSRVLPGDWADPKSVYAIDLPQRRDPLLVGWGPGLEGQDELIEQLEQEAGALLFVTSLPEAEYRIDLENEKWIICPAGSERPLFKGIASTLAKAIDLFVARLEHVGDWLEGWKRSNPDTSLNVLQQFDVQLLTYPDYQHDDAPGKPVELDYRDDMAVLSYQERNGQWIKPYITFTLQRRRDESTYQGSLWACVLFYNEKYGATASHFPVQEFQPDDTQAVRLFYLSGGRRRFYIPLYIPDILYEEWGETEVKNMFKVVISTRPFSADDWELPDLELARRSPKGIGRGIGDEEDRGPLRDWATFDIPFIIRRPTEGQSLPSGGRVAMDRIQMQAPAGFGATKVRLASSQEVSRSISGAKPPPSIPGCVEPANLVASRQADGAMDVLELHDVTGTEQVDAEHPLMLQLEPGSREALLPMGYDAEIGAYLPLGYTDAQGMVRIQSLPAPDEPTVRGLGKSLKIYLQRLKYTQLLGKEDPYPKLAMVGWKGQEPVYVLEEPDIVKAVASAKKILVVVHGLIGDTSDKRAITRRIKRPVEGEWRPLSDQIDLTLTFDYDSLSVPIEQTARDLKAALETVDCRKNDQREVILIAHSMGGLVSRWLLEEEGGDALISAFLEVGSPNAGSPWASAYDVFVNGMGTVLNFLPIPLVVNSLLSFVSKAWDKVEVTQQQLRPDSEIIKTLNRADKQAPIPYLIVPGDSSLIPDEGQRRKLIARMLERLKSGAVNALFDSANDDIVSVASMKAVPKGNVQVVDAAACDHFGYFNTDAGVERLGEVLWDGRDSRDKETKRQRD